MIKIKTLKQQKGMALIIGLIVIVVSSIIVAASMRSTTSQEKMTGSQNNKAISLHAAEKGANEIYESLKSNLLGSDPTSWSNTIAPQALADARKVSDFGYFYIDSITVTPIIGGAATGNEISMIVRGISKPSSTSSTVLAKTDLNIIITDKIDNEIESVEVESWDNIMGGFMSDAKIKLSGNANLLGEMHTNGSIEVSGQYAFNNQSKVSAVGTITQTGGGGSLTLPTGATQGASAQTVQDADAFIASAATNTSYLTDCSNLSGDLGGKIYYCSGNVTIKNSPFNGMVISAGDITTSGDIGQTGKPLNLIASGTITAGGAPTINGILWTGTAGISTDGKTAQVQVNGAAKVYGGIISKGIIDLNGASEVKQIGSYAKDTPLYTPKYAERTFVVRRVTINNWKENIE